MKRFGIIFSFVALFSAFLTSVFLTNVACDKHPVSTPMPPPTATPPFVYYIVEDTNVGFSPASVTILAGSKVVWTNSGPSFSQILMDQNGPANGCIGSGKFLFAGQGVTYQFNSAPLTIDFQDIFLSANGGSPCSPQASAFAGQVIVQ